MLFGKKKKEEKAENGKKELVLDDSLAGKNIAVHTMPERFRIKEQNPAQAAKRTGIFVLVFGIVFLVVMSVIVYIYLFRVEPLTTEESSLSDAKPVQQEPTAEKEPAASVRESYDRYEPETSEEYYDYEEEVVPESGLSEEDIRETVAEVSTTTIEIPATIATSGDMTIETPQATSTSAPPPPSAFKIPTDRDSDGLSDAEEALIGSDQNLADSDFDGYDDYAEILNAYNPAGSGKIADNPAMARYHNETFKYSFVYPSSWTVRQFGGEDSLFMESPDGHFMQIISQTNGAGSDIQEWYKRQFSLDDTVDFSVIDGNGWQGVANKDGLTVYLTGDDRQHIFTLTYNPGVNDTLLYRGIFDLVISSFTPASSDGF